MAQYGIPGSAAELLHHDAVLYGKADGSSNLWLIAHDSGQIERHLIEGRIIVASPEAQVSAINAGLGIAQLAT